LYYNHIVVNGNDTLTGMGNAMFTFGVKFTECTPAGRFWLI